jgi:hypothetical protein
MPRGSKDHVAGIVHDHVDAPLVVQDGRDVRIDRGWVRDVHLNQAEVDVLFGGVAGGVSRSLLVAGLAGTAR